MRAAAPGIRVPPGFRVLSALAGVVSAAALAACGGGGGGGPSGPDRNEVLACAQDAGLRGVATGGDEALGTSGGLRLNVSADNRIVVDFFDHADAAQSYSDGQGAFLGGAGGGGSSEVVDETAVIGTFGPGAADQVANRG
jgi:hypothetical protein